MDAACPNEELARAIALRFASVGIATVTRFANGLCHHVYDVKDARQRPYVIRIARHGNESMLAGALYWHERLRAIGVPVARILAADLSATNFGFAYLVLERLPGSDLGTVYSRLSTATKSTLGRRMAAIQRATAKLPAARGYGEVWNSESTGHARWADASDLDDTDRGRLGYYTALFAAVLLSEHGVRFNQSEAVHFESTALERLRGLLDTAPD